MPKRTYPKRKKTSGKLAILVVLEVSSSFLPSSWHLLAPLLVYLVKHQADYHCKLSLEVLVWLSKGIASECLSTGHSMIRFILVGAASGDAGAKKSPKAPIAKQPKPAAAKPASGAPKAVSKGAVKAPRKPLAPSQAGKNPKEKALRAKQAIKKGTITTRKRKIRTSVTFKLPRTLKTPRAPKFPRKSVPHRARYVFMIAFLPCGWPTVFWSY